MPAEARAPAVDVLLQLRSAWLFADVPPPILAVVASHAHQRAFAAGEHVYRAGAPVTAAHIIVDGRLRIEVREGKGRTFERGETVGLLPLLTQRPVALEARAEVASRSLELPADTLFDILEDHFSLLEHFLRALCRLLIAERSRLPDNAGYEPPVQALSCPARPLDLVERIIALRRTLPLARTSTDALAELSRHMTEVRLGPRERLWEIGAPADALIFPVCGTIVHSTAGGRQTFRVGSGSVVGVLDALGGVPRWCESRTEDELVALRVEIGHFMDVLDNEITLSMALLASLANEALQLLAGQGDGGGFERQPA